MFCFNVIVFLLFVVSRLPLWGEGLLPFRYSEAFYPSVILRLAEESNPFRSFADAQDDRKKLSALRVAVSRLPLGGKLSALRTDEGNNLPCPSSVAYATPSPTGEGLLPFRYSEAFYPFVILRLAEESNPFRSFADAQDDNDTLNFAQDDSNVLKQQKKCGSRKRVTPLQDTISLRLPHQNKTFANCYVLMDKAYVKEAN